MTNLEVGALASHFTLLGLDGREYSIPSGIEGKLLLLVFFRPSCRTCDVAFPYINRLRHAYPEGVQVWAVSQDDAARARPYAEKFALDYPVLIDAPALDVSLLYDPPSTPTAFLIAPDGRIEYVSEGFAKTDLNKLSERVAARLGVQSVEIAAVDDGQPAMKPGCMARQRLPRRR